MPPTDATATPGGSTRSTPVAFLLIAGVLLAARIATGVWAEARPADRPDLMTWTSPSAAAEAARERGRPILYVFTNHSSAASRKMAGELFGDPEVVHTLGGRFIAVRIDGPPGADTPETAALREKYEVSQFPTMVVVSPDGEKSRRIAGYVGASPALRQLMSANVELMGMPEGRVNRGFQFQIGGPPPIPGDASGAPDSTEAGR